MVKTAIGNNPLSVEVSVHQAMVDLDTKMPPVVLLASSDDMANKIITERTKDDDQYRKTPIESVPGNFNGHEIWLLVIGPTRGLNFKVTSDSVRIYVHITHEPLSL